jgi:FAD/FMN-containing dehydrogenase
MEKAFENKQAAAGAGGPGQTDFYRFVTAAQGSMGIVTWISVKCEILPEPHKLYFVTADKLDALIDFTYQVLRVRFGDELLILNNTELAYILGESPDQISTLRSEIPPWVTLVGIAGRSILPQERVAFQEKDIADMAQNAGLKLTTEIPGTKNGEVLETILNVSTEPYWKLAYKGGYQDILFLTTLNRTPEFIKTMNSIAEASGYPVGDIGVYLQPLHQGASCHCEFTLPYNRNNPEEAAKMQQLYAGASEKLIDTGAFFSRPYGIWAKMAYARDPSTVRVLKKLKGIFDPNNIMNPGKLCF